MSSDGDDDDDRVEEQEEEKTCWLTWSRSAAGSVSSHEEMAFEIGDSAFGFGGRLGFSLWWCASVEVGGGGGGGDGAVDMISLGILGSFSNRKKKKRNPKGL